MMLLGREPRRDMNGALRRALDVMIASGAALAAFVAARPAAAYCRTTTCPTCDYDQNGCPTGIPIAWPTSCVSFSMQYLASQQIDLATATSVMEKAFGVWHEASCDDGTHPAVQIDHHFGTASCALHEYNQTDANANIVMFRDVVWPYEGSNNVLALTTVTYSRKTGAIFDVDMEINATQRLSVDDMVPQNAYDLQSIVTHEAGHFLGLAHSTVRSATMWPMYTAGSESFRQLDPDDVGGICAVFPAGTAAQCDATPRQGFSPDCGMFPSGDAGKCSVARGELASRRRDDRSWFALAALLGAVAALRRSSRD